MFKGVTMKRLLSVAAVTVFAIVGCGKKGAFTETIDSPYDIDTTIKRFKQTLADRNLTYFNTIDHKANAVKAGLQMREERVVFFGNPKMGTILMQCNPSIGVDLPLRMLFWQDYDGVTKITFTNPEYLSLKHNIKEQKCLKLIQHAHVIMRELAEETAKAEAKTSTGH
jgi:uncharacterized protein (DUF302 family)